MEAAIQGHLEIVKLLVACGADQDLHDRFGKTGMTALEHASRNGRGDVVKELGGEEATKNLSRYKQAVNRV